MLTSPQNDSKVLLLAMEYGYGQEHLGKSYEHIHFYEGMKGHFSSVENFDYVSQTQSLGKQAMQHALEAKLSDYRADVIVYVPYQDDFDPPFLEKLKEYAPTLYFFHDDVWRKDYVKQLVPHSSAFTTTCQLNLNEYQAASFGHPVYFPFGVNTDFFKPVTSEKDIDVSFIGAWHPYRAWMLKQLKKHGVNVQTYGQGWPQGTIDYDEMIAVLSRSKISLNLSNSTSWDARYLLSSPRALRNTLRSPKNHEQIKGRHFEIPACNTLQISYYVEGLPDLLFPGKEIVLYGDVSDLIEKTQFYLKHDRLREEIAHKGFQRVVREHDYGARFACIFTELGWLA